MSADTEGGQAQLLLRVQLDIVSSRRANHALDPSQDDDPGFALFLANRPPIDAR